METSYVGIALLGQQPNVRERGIPGKLAGRLLNVDIPLPAPLRNMQARQQPMLCAIFPKLPWSSKLPRECGKYTDSQVLFQTKRSRIAKYRSWASVFLISTSDDFSDWASLGNKVGEKSRDFGFWKTWVWELALALVISTLVSYSVKWGHDPMGPASLLEGWIMQPPGRPFHSPAPHS